MQNSTLVKTLTSRTKSCRKSMAIFQKSDRY